MQYALFKLEWWKNEQCYLIALIRQSSSSTFNMQLEGLQIFPEWTCSFFQPSKWCVVIRKWLFFKILLLEIPYLLICRLSMLIYSLFMPIRSLSMLICTVSMVIYTLSTPISSLSMLIHSPSMLIFPLFPFVYFLRSFFHFLCPSFTFYAHFWLHGGSTKYQPNQKSPALGVQCTAFVWKLSTATKLERILYFPRANAYSFLTIGEEWNSLSNFFV